jgi:hypothetical protein
MGEVLRDNRVAAGAHETDCISGTGVNIEKRSRFLIKGQAGGEFSAASGEFRAAVLPAANRLEAQISGVGPRREKALAERIAGRAGGIGRDAAPRRAGCRSALWEIFLDPSQAGRVAKGE